MSVTVEVEVDVSEVISDIPTKDLFEELSRRRHGGAHGATFMDLDMLDVDLFALQNALEWWQRGARREALCNLEIAFNGAMYGLAEMKEMHQ